MATMVANAATFSGTGLLQMSRNEAMMASLKRGERVVIYQSHPYLMPQAAPPVNRGGWKKTYLTRHKTAGDIVSERGSQATAMLTNLDIQIKDLEATIAKDEKSLKEMDTNIMVANQAFSRLKRRIFEEEKIVRSMAPEEGLGNAIKQFDGQMSEVKVTYKHLRGRHADAIQILRDEFRYSPCFKKGTGVSPDREFSGAYFTLAKDPSKLLASSGR